jgi:transcriptional regulator with XRE-family HTH domain
MIIGNVPNRNPELQAGLNLFGASVRTARRDARMSQEELAHRSGLHRTYIGSVERGERNISLASAWALADTLGVQLAVLLSQGETPGEID